jgi:hypothetical protein
MRALSLDRDFAALSSAWWHSDVAAALALAPHLV